MKIQWKLENPQTESTGKEAAFLEVDMDLLYMTYSLFPPGLLSRFKTLNAFFGKSTSTDIQASELPVYAPGTYPANGHDIYNYVARFGAANYQIQAVLQLDGLLDPDKLKQAVRLAVDTEPVFGCRFVEADPPYWKRLDPLDEVPFCTYENAENREEAVQQFLESPLDMDNDPMVKMKLIRCGPQDTLCMKVNHTCCDGTGTKEFLHLLADIYSLLDQEGGTYVPQPKARTRKDQDRLFESLGIRNPDDAWNPLLEAPKSMWAFPWKRNQPADARTAVCKLPYGYVQVLSRYGKPRGATINDLLLTACYRAMFAISAPEPGIPMDISITVDLRRYLPGKKTEAIRNFSGGADTRIPRIENESFEGTLARVKTMMEQIKSGRPGLQSAVGLERVERAIFHETLDFYRNSGNMGTKFVQCAPVMSNLGQLHGSNLKFGGISVADAHIVPPAVSSPGLLLCIGTYNSIITMAMSYYESQTDRRDIERLLNLIREELMKACRP